MAVKVGIENITSKFSSGIVYVNLYDKNGYLVKYVYNNIALNGLAEDHFNVSLTKEDNATYAEIGIWDSEKTKNNYSNVIVQPLD